MGSVVAAAAAAMDESQPAQVLVASQFYPDSVSVQVEDPIPEVNCRLFVVHKLSLLLVTVSVE
jgi:hypothetical protein